MPSRSQHSSFSNYASHEPKRVLKTELKGSTCVSLTLEAPPLAASFMSRGHRREFVR